MKIRNFNTSMLNLILHYNLACLHRSNGSKEKRAGIYLPQTPEKLKTGSKKITLIYLVTSAAVEVLRACYNS